MNMLRSDSRDAVPAPEDVPADAPRAFPLALAQGGERLRIAAFKTGKGLGRKLSNLGLPVGSEIEVLQRQAGGGVVVSRDSTRVALGAGTAQKIMVFLAADGPDRA